MASSGKRLDLRFGAFACSVQGFDDPVQPVQQILRAIQHLLEESPELSDAGINFDAEAIEQLIGEVARRAELEESQIEIVPGLIVIHHGEGGDLADAPSSWASAAGEDSWSAGQAGDEAGGDYVNIFSRGGDAAAEPSAGGGDAAEGEEEEFTERLRRMAAGDDDGYGWDEDGGDAAEGEAGIREAASDAAAEDEEAPLNLFADDAAEREAEPGAGAPERNLFAVGEGATDAEETGDDWQLVPDATGGEAETAPEAGAGNTAADLAKRAGAESVPDLMVAAAAWMVLTQGQTSFTRRDVLDVFETIPGEHENTPEARIKGFGKAVRNGQLVATSDGIFGLARAELARFQELV